MQTELLILGLDEVLFATDGLQRDACNAAFAACGLTLRWNEVDYREAMRRHGAACATDAAILAAGASLPATVLRQEKNRLFHAAASQSGLPLHADAQRLIRQATERGSRLAIVTDMAAATAALLLERAFGDELHLLFAVIVADADFNAAPENGPHHLALRTAGADPRDCLAIDAGAPALRSAHAAGIRCSDGVEARPATRRPASGQVVRRPAGRKPSSARSLPA